LVGGFDYPRKSLLSLGGEKLIFQPKYDPGGKRGVRGDYLVKYQPGIK
jgi:hypothetical protein